MTGCHTVCVNHGISFSSHSTLVKKQLPLKPENIHWFSPCSMNYGAVRTWRRPLSLLITSEGIATGLETKKTLPEGGATDNKKVTEKRPPPRKSIWRLCKEPPHPGQESLLNSSQIGFPNSSVSLLTCHSSLLE